MKLLKNRTLAFGNKIEALCALAFVLTIASGSSALAQKNPEDANANNNKHEQGKKEGGAKHVVNPHGTPDAYEKSLYKPEKYPPKQTEFTKKGVIKKFKKLPKDIAQNCAALLYKGCPRHWVEKMPGAWDAMKERHARMQPTVENSMSFANLEESYKEVCKGASNYHCCWGHTSTTQKFSALAFFDPTNSVKEVIPAKGTKEWHEFYHQKIEKIMNYEGTVIPGFANLFEFSSVPEIQVYMKQRIMDEWAHQALKLNLANAKIFLSGHFRLGEVELDTLFDDLQRELDKGYNPRIYFTAAGASMKNPNGMAIHVVQVIKVDKHPDGHGKIWLWDISNQADKTKTSITVKADGRAYYDKWDDVNTAEDEARLSDIKMTPENKDDAALTAMALFKFKNENPEVFERLK